MLYSNQRENKTKEEKMNIELKKYTKMGIVATAVVVVALIGVFVISSMRSESNLATALEKVSAETAKASDLSIAVINMDKIQLDSKALQDLRKQRTSYEEKLKNRLEKEQKAIEKEKADIEKSQDVLSQEALQRRVVEYQRRVSKLQRDLTESAQAIEASYQKALNTLQQKHLDPVIEGVIAKKKLSLVIDGRMARVGKDVKNLDITPEVVEALNKKVSSVKMEKPKGF